MKKIFISFLLSFILSTLFLSALPPNDYVVPLCRQLSKDLFDLNAQPYLSPTVKMVNATSNAAFFHSAYVPKKVDKPYFRLSLNGMLGFVSNDMKTFAPQIPMQEFNFATASKYLMSSDTAGLLNYFLQTLFYDGIVTTKTITPPTSAATSLGSETSVLYLPHDVMENLVKNSALMNFLKNPILGFDTKELEAQIDSAISSLPEAITLFPGGDLNTIIAGVPQLEIGSLFGTELLLRIIPPIDLGKYVGKFEFWGVGLKHSISQYFYKDNNHDGNIEKRNTIAPFDLAVQAIYQKTKLTNTVGTTSSQLVAKANIFNINVHASKNFNNIIEAYTGISYENIDINGTYTYTLPVEMQWRLGLMTIDTVTKVIYADPPEYPGDNEPQTSAVKVNESHIKWTLGVCKNIGPFTVYLDYSVSKFNIFSGGVQYRF